MPNSLKDFNEAYLQPTLAGVLIAGIPLLMGWLAVGAPLLKRHQARDWVESPTDVLEAELVERGGRGGTSYETIARYSYTFAGGRYEGTKISFFDGGKQFYRELAKYEESGESFRCYVNPDNPHEAVLYRNVDWGTVIFTGSIAVLFGGAGVLLIVVTWKKAFVPPGEKVLQKKEGERLPHLNQEEEDLYASMFKTIVLETIQEAEGSRGKKPNAFMFMKKLTEKMREAAQEIEKAPESESKLPSSEERTDDKNRFGRD